MKLLIAVIVIAAMLDPLFGQFSLQDANLIGSGGIGSTSQSISTSVSADGNTVIVGGIGDDSSKGAAWIFSRNGATWNQQGSKLV